MKRTTTTVSETSGEQTPSMVPPQIAAAVSDPRQIRTRAIDRAAYAADASHYLLTPQAVIVAADAEEVAAILRGAAASRTPVTFRAGGTSLSGQAASSGILVDVRRNFRKIEVLDQGRRVRVQPGATVAQVNARLLRYGFRLGPDPASETACTIGGVIANNSSGMACGIEHNTYHTLESMVFVLPSGTRIDTADPQANAQLREREPALTAGLLRLQRRVRQNPESLALIARQFSLKNTMGYGINAFVDFDEPVELLARLIIGSEGTLAFVAEATFRTLSISKFVNTSLVVFDTLDAATRSLPQLVESGAATLELMDSTSLRIGQSLAQAPPEILGFTPTSEAALLVEYRADEQEELAGLAATGAQLLRAAGARGEVEFASEAARRAAAWSFRKGLYASVAGARPSGTTALLEDIVVPTGQLADTCAAVQRLFERYEYRDSVIFGHAKDGNIHFMLTDRFADEAALARYLGFTDDLVDLVLTAGGNLKAEHGTGRAMAPYVSRQYGAELYEVMCELKQLCDPARVMNPGVLIAEDAAAHLQDMKLPPSVEAEVDRCVECGFCEPVCPSRDLTLTPRQRIATRRAEEAARLRGDYALAAELAADYDYDGVQSCAVDGMCQTVCPVNINTGDLVRRLRREQANPMLARGWDAAAGNWGSVTRLAATALTVAKATPSEAVRGVTTLGRKLLGEDVVPHYDAGLPAGGASRRSLGSVIGDPEGQLLGLYLPACVNSIFGAAGESGKDSGVAAAFVALLARAGLRMEIPDGIESLCCGTPWSSKGFAAGYAKVKDHTLRRVVESIADRGLPVVSDASSCTEGFAKMLAGAGVSVEDAVQFTAREILPRLSFGSRMRTLVLHTTCSSRQQGFDEDLRQLAAAIAEEVVVPDEWGCCGFAGDRGMLHPELTAAATAPAAAELRSLRADGYASCNRTCELGMSRATGREYRHILELLADALG